MAEAAVLREGLTMIGSHDDDCVVQDLKLAEGSEQAPELEVDRADLVVVEVSKMVHIGGGVDGRVGPPELAGSDHGPGVGRTVAGATGIPEGVGVVDVREVNVGEEWAFAVADPLDQTSKLVCSVTVAAASTHELEPLVHAEIRRGVATHHDGRRAVRARLHQLSKCLRLLRDPGAGVFHPVGGDVLGEEER
jgi:hypothetical protein